MPCEKFKDAIVRAAAGAMKPEGELCSHLAACEECCAAFAFEQSLFASIDSGVRAVANSDVPTLLLANVRVRLQEENSSRHKWISAWPGLAGATLAVFTVLIVSAGWQLKTSDLSSSTAPNEKTPIAASQAARNGLSLRAGVSPKAGTVPPAENRAETVAVERNSTTVTPAIEVLVPQDQEFLLANYAKELRRKNKVTMAAENLDAAEPKPLQVELIQIAQLDVKPLAEVTFK